ncbi:MAG: NfeD family protein [Microthrixaceae bacterium]
MGKSATSRIVARTLWCLLVVVLGVLLLGPAASAQDGDAPQTCADDGCVDVVAVDGLIDEIEATNIVDSITAADDSGDVEAVVLQLDSQGSAVSDGRLAEVARVIESSSVPVTVWIGPTGSVALGGAAELVAVADSSGIAPGAKVGDVGAQRLPVDEFGELYGGDRAVAIDRTFEGQAAVDAGLVDRFAPIVREHIVNIDGVRSEITDEDGERARAPVALVRFSKLPIGTQIMHTVASPSVAYLLLVIGLGLLLFEFFTAGVGIAGVVGAGSLVLAAYGVAALPFNIWALVLVVLSILAFAVDVQSGVPRAWTVIGAVAVTVGSLFLFTEFRPTWLALLAGVAGMAVAMFSGMPSMVRARFATPTIGREWMLGEEGTAATAVDPDGTVRIRGALWRARTNRATPIPQDDPVRVAEIDGLTLEVEPIEGAARDHREMRGRSRE